MHFLTIAMLALLVVSVARRFVPLERRPTWTACLPVAAFLAAALQPVLVERGPTSVVAVALGVVLSVSVVFELWTTRRDAPRSLLRRAGTGAMHVLTVGLLAITLYAGLFLRLEPTVLAREPLPVVVAASGPVVVADHSYLRSPRDLAFDPLRPGRLWVVNGDDGSVAILHDATTNRPEIELRRDSHASHFLHRPSAIAFGSPDTTLGASGSFATAQESRDDAYGLPTDFMGPTLWSSDLAVFASRQSPDLLGSHLDMLHESPLAMGIAWERDHVYWVFSGASGSISRYDFVEDHGVGHDDHSNGVIRHYGPDVVRREPGVPSHLVFHARSGLLFVADTGNGRVVTLDTASGTPGADGPGIEADVDTRMMDDFALAEFVGPGVLTRPSGIALAGDVLLVGDHATGLIHSFALDGSPLETIDSTLGPNALMGMTIGPDGLLYYVDHVRCRVLRLELPGALQDLRDASGEANPVAARN